MAGMMFSNEITIGVGVRVMIAAGTLVCCEDNNLTYL